MDIIGKKKWFFLISLLVIIPGIISLFLWGLDLSIDFAGGSQFVLIYPNAISDSQKQIIDNTFTNQKIEVGTTQVFNNQITLKTSLINSQEHSKVIKALHTTTGSFKEDTFETVGPTIGSETTSNAFKAVILASILIVLFIALSFRSVPKPASSFRFGICAIIALLHDVLVLLGIFSILGHFFHVEVDTLFVTAVLTVIGFSVHDTIVVFDRIRENLKRLGAPFPQVVNASILQTMSRSLNTSLTVILVLLGLLLFGGQSTLWFVVALLIGVISGTYSSIFNASPLLVVWHEWSQKRKNK